MTHVYNWKSRKVPGLSAAARAHWRGWVFKRLNDVVLFIAYRAGQAPYGTRPKRTPEQQRKAMKVLTDAQRVWNYVRQNEVHRPLTPRQQRRRRHKANRMGQSL
jgi:hypothetical protein